MTPSFPRTGVSGHAGAVQLGGSGYQNFGGLSSGFSNLGSGVSGFANRGILPFSVASVVSGFANIGTNLAGFFQGTTS
ncbi:hypothetical protein FHI80_13625 [Mycobacterium orygis]|uniref:PPE family protein n=2 Tax=Mycobacterium orygis TaxID=1305738 RepID=A0AAU0QCD0_9MYCO|nr:hypothetical protein [Mycobacterium orygis]TPD50838.1 hypothetical protein FHI80_13625 [Mycobacterium orygis]UOA02929.1 hypothetical protein RJtmp_001833 [Mycobacterium orygis]WPF63904.1 hypothetical protein MO_001862 [Mycobacterium orygis]